MAVTLPEAAKLSNDILLSGVIETIYLDSPVLQQLPFIDIVGNGLTYNQELTLGEIQMYSVGDEWHESTPTFAQHTAVLKIMGGDAEVDEFLKATRSDVNDLEQVVTEMKAKALRQKFETMFIYGNATTNPKEFDGIAKLIDIYTASDQVIPCTGAVTGGVLALDELDKLFDAVKGGNPDMFLCSRRTRRQINALLRDSTGIAIPTKDAYGNWATNWNGVPIYISDAILDTHNVSSSQDTGVLNSTDSHLYAFAFGEGALVGLQAPGGITAVPLGVLERKDAIGTRIKWYVSMALFCSLKAAALIGISA